VRVVEHKHQRRLARGAGKRRAEDIGQALPARPRVEKLEERAFFRWNGEKLGEQRRVWALLGCEVRDRAIDTLPRNVGRIVRLDAGKRA
jgi:hypothetical protein